MFVKTDTILDRILTRKAEELQAVFARTWHDPSLMSDLLEQVSIMPPPRNFAAALRRDTVALIAEIKKASPSKGVLIENFDPVALGELYAANGAAAISILTDQDFFQGHLDHLRAVRAQVDVPILRKEFIIDAYQVYEGRAAGADAILLIVAALDDETMADLHRLITTLGMSALVEVHNEAELERAMKIGATLIGVNNRDLKTFHEDLDTTARIARLVPSTVTLVAESAIRSLDDVRRMGQLGAHAVLVGEGLVKSDNIAQQVQAFSSIGRR